VKMKVFLQLLSFDSLFQPRWDQNQLLLQELRSFDEKVLQLVRVVANHQDVFDSRKREDRLPQ